METQHKVDICQYLKHGAVNGQSLAQLAKAADIDADAVLYNIRMARLQKQLIIERNGRFFLPSRNARTAKAEILNYMQRLSSEDSNAIEYR